MLLALIGCTRTMDKINDGASSAQQAAAYYASGDVIAAQIRAEDALRQNSSQVLALLVSGLCAEASHNPNQAKAFYERLVLLNPDDLTLLTKTDLIPIKMVDLAKKRIRALNIQNSEIIIQDYDGNTTFNIKEDIANKQNRSALEEALFLKQQNDIRNSKNTGNQNNKAVEILFSNEETNKISRFLILKELAENDLITKDEFLTARTNNLGALLPLTNRAPAYGLDKPVPSADIIVERITILKEGVKDKSITSQEFSAERDTIIKSLLPPNPRTRAQKEKPEKDILTAAKNLRKLEVLFDLNLITKKEKEAEIKEIENYLGLNQEPKIVEKIIHVPAPQPKTKTKEKQKNKETKKEIEPPKAPTATPTISVREIEEILKNNKSSTTPDVPTPDLF